MNPSTVIAIVNLFEIFITGLQLVLICLGIYLIYKYIKHRSVDF